MTQLKCEICGLELYGGYCDDFGCGGIGAPIQISSKQLDEVKTHNELVRNEEEDVVKQRRKEEEKYPYSDWQYDVACSYTNLGYTEWVDHKIESEGGIMPCQ